MGLRIDITWFKSSLTLSSINSAFDSGTLNKRTFLLRSFRSVISETVSFISQEVSHLATDDLLI